MKLQMSSSNRLIVAMLGIAVLAVAFWMLLLAPKRDEAGKLEKQVAELEASLDPARFVRIHRSYLLNVDRLARLESEGETRTAILTDGTRLPVSRAGHARLKALL